MISVFLPDYIHKTTLYFLIPRTNKILYLWFRHGIFILDVSAAQKPLGGSVGPTCPRLAQARDGFAMHFPMIRTRRLLNIM